MHDVKYVAILSPIALSRTKLARTPLFDATGEFHLTKATARGAVVCSFTKTIADSTTFPNANGANMTVKVYGGSSPDLTSRVCKAFGTFSLNWLHGAVVGRKLDPLNGISAARHANVGAGVLPPDVLAEIQRMNASYVDVSRPGLELPRLRPATARLLGKAPDGALIYALTDTRGDLCLVGEAAASCAARLSKSQPITMTMGNASPTTGGTFIVSGAAIDSVRSVSFTVWGRKVTVPVRHNVYLYKRRDTTAHGTECVVVRFADGSTVQPFPALDCLSSARR